MFTLAGLIAIGTAATAQPQNNNQKVDSTVTEPNAQQVAQGEVKELSFNSSAIFPGTERRLWVFIPAQYTGAQPACVMVHFDGYDPARKPILEGLIASQEMPVTIGVFVESGNVPPPRPEAMARRNRSFEYDGMGDNQVRFLTEELLPFVERELDLKLSTDGNDRCIVGASSGGIAAFNVAWERPEAFSRVYACSGSFVAFRGGHEFPTLVRKFEAKPIRAFLSTGTHDMENCAGDWYLLDQEMDKALKFSGYDYQFRTVEGPHGAGYTDLFPEALRYIWKGWPTPVQAGPSAPRVQDVIIAGEPWQALAEGYQSAGAAAVNAAGEVFFIDAGADKIFRIGTDGKVQTFLADAKQASGLTTDPEGHVITVSRQTGQVLRYETDDAPEVLCEGLFGDSILALPDGSFYISGGADATEDGEVWLLRKGVKTRVDAGLKQATGLSYRPDQWLLSVADGASKWAYSYQINPDGSLSHKERFFHLIVSDSQDDAGAQAVCYAREGQMFVATHIGVQICADDGATQSVLPLPDHSRPLGVCLGGAQGDTLFAFCGEKIWQRKIKCHAYGAFSPFTAIAGTPL